MNYIFDKPISEQSRIRYRGRNHSAMGRLALGIGIVGWVLFLVLVIDSGKASVDTERIGLLGAGDFVLAVIGMIFGGRGLRESNVFYRSALWGVLVCTILAATLFSLYLGGTVI